MNKESKLCECGCGEYAKPGNRFIVGHNGRVFSDEVRDKISKSVKKYQEENPITDEVRKKLSEASIRYWSDSNAREKQSNILKKYYEDTLLREKRSEMGKKRYKDNLPVIGTYPELVAVDEEATYEQFGYYSTQLSKKSGKLIVRVCVNCGKSIIIPKYAYSSLCHKCATQTDEFRKKRSEIATKQFSTEEGREKDRQGTIKRWLDPEEHIKASIANKKAQGTDEARKANSERTLQYHKDHPEKGEQHSIFMNNFYSDEENRDRASARSQGQDYDAGEWTGYAPTDRPHLINASQCIHLNSKFDGSVQHHIMSGVIINIPTDLHRSVWHKMSKENKNGKNMEEINELAFQYLLNGI